MRTFCKHNEHAMEYEQCTVNMQRPKVYMFSTVNKPTKEFPNYKEQGDIQK